jgi:hypothetical protein
MSFEVSTTTPAKKTRGRKTKANNVVLSSSLQKDLSMSASVTNLTNNEPILEEKKRKTTKISKKKTPIVAEESFGIENEDNLNSGQTSSSLSFSNSFILHLNVSKTLLNDDYENMSSYQKRHDTLEKDMFRYSPNIVLPQPYDTFEDDNNNTDSVPCPLNQDEKLSIDRKLSNIQQKEQFHTESFKELKKNGLYSVSYSNQQNDTKDNENFIKNCWWCCETYHSTTSCTLPIRKLFNGFITIGTFCCPECTVAYLFDSGHKYGDVFKQYSWLHELYQRKEDNDVLSIEAAPPRECLQKFGGPYTIDVYRQKLTDYNTHYQTTNHPLLPMNGFTDEIVVEYKNSKSFFPMNQERMNKACSDLKLKRKKIKKNENTLEEIMQLKIS